VPARSYVVPEISCDHCKHAIEAEVSRVAGVESVDVSVATKTVHVEGPASDGDIRAAIVEAGYEDIRKDS
jgi:copper chaperone CopZ